LTTFFTNKKTWKKTVKNVKSVTWIKNVYYINGLHTYVVSMSVV